MSPIEAVGHFEFSADKLDAIKRIVDDCIRIVQEKDSGTLQYDWLFSGDKQHAVVREKYVDSAALLTHAANVASHMSQLQALTAVSIEVYGNPSEQLLAALAGMGIPVFRRYAGLT